jgi:hypothetical protein
MCTCVHAEGVPIPDHVLTTLLLSAHTLSSMPPIDRGDLTSANQAFFTLIFLDLPALVGMIPKQALVPPAPGIQLADPKGSAARTSSSASGREGAGGTGRRAGGSSAQKMDPGSLGQSHSLPGSTQPPSANHAPGDGAELNVEEAKSCTDRVRYLVEARGTIYGCWCAISRGQQTAVVTDTIIKGMWTNHQVVHDE